MIEDMIRSIQAGKEWSWSVVGILAILIGLTIRSFLLRDILHEMKIRNRSWYYKTQSIYQGRAFLGWAFFILFLSGTMLLWRFESFFLKYLTVMQWLSVLIALLALSIICHLRAYARAIVEAMQENVAMDKEL